MNEIQIQNGICQDTVSVQHVDISKNNRFSQAIILCTNCGYATNADENVAGNIQRAGRLGSEL